MAFAPDPEQMRQAYATQLASQRNQAQRGVQDIYAQRGTTGGGEEAQAFGQLGQQFGAAAGAQEAQLQQYLGNLGEQQARRLQQNAQYGTSLNEQIAGRQQQGTQFGQNLSQAERQFNQNLGEQRSQFSRNLGQRETEFNTGQQNWQSQFGEQRSQFSRDLGQRETEFNTGQQNWQSQFKEGQGQFGRSLGEQQRQFNVGQFGNVAGTGTSLGAQSQLFNQNAMLANLYSQGMFGRNPFDVTPAEHGTPGGAPINPWENVLSSQQQNENDPMYKLARKLGFDSPEEMQIAQGSDENKFRELLWQAGITKPDTRSGPFSAIWTI